MVVGCLGDIPFEASSEAVRTIKNAIWSGSARYSTHSRHLNNALTEFTGLDPDAFSFDMQLSAFLGVNPNKAINKLWEYERTGKAVSLVLGTKAYGKYRWSVLNHKPKLEQYDGDGDLASCTVTVKLQEYLRG